MLSRYCTVVKVGERPTLVRCAWLTIITEPRSDNVLNILMCRDVFLSCLDAATEIHPRLDTWLSGKGKWTSMGIHATRTPDTRRAAWCIPQEGSFLPPHRFLSWLRLNLAISNLPTSLGLQASLFPVAIATLVFVSEKAVWVGAWREVKEVEEEEEEKEEEDEGEVIYSNCKVTSKTFTCLQLLTPL